MASTAKIEEAPKVDLSFLRRQIEPVGHFVFVKMPKLEEKIGSIYLPAETKDKQERGCMTGELLGVGPECKFVSADAVGKTAHFARYAGLVVEDGDDVYRLIDEDEIRALS